MFFQKLTNVENFPAPRETASPMFLQYPWILTVEKSVMKCDTLAKVTFTWACFWTWGCTWT